MKELGTAGGRKDGGKGRSGRNTRLIEKDEEVDLTEAGLLREEG